MKMKNKWWSILAIIAVVIGTTGIFPVNPVLAESNNTWKAEYFNNRTLSGTPVVTREDKAIDYDWLDGSPDTKVQSDNFSVRWTRTLGFTPGTYRFYASCDDGVRIYVDGVRVVDAWKDQSLPNTRTGDINISSGSHKLVVEYYEHEHTASAHVWWDLLQTFTGWKGRYYDNTQLRGGPVLIRDDADLDFDWSDGAPVSWMPIDNFSVVWTRTLDFVPGHYRLNVRSDDGVRVYLDQKLVMDYWKTQDNSWHYLERVYLSGSHTLKIEYFESTGYARIHFWWSGADEPIVLDSRPATPSSGPLTGPWQGEYFNNRNLEGNAALIRTDAALDFNWKWEAPATSINRDNFSVRWTGAFPFDTGRYRFTTMSDDGVRVYVDDQIVIDAWRPMRGTRTGLVTLTQGQHTVRVEYFERSQAAMAQVSAQLLSATSIVRTPMPQPRPCTTGQLRLDAWPVAKTCIPGGGWSASIYVAGFGGDCRYTYSWENQIQGGPTPESMVFEVKSASRGSSIVGKAAVQSAGQTVSVGVYVPEPTCP
jgi:hypothetical protein